MHSSILASRVDVLYVRPYNIRTYVHTSYIPGMYDYDYPRPSRRACRWVLEVARLPE